jgi:hypothetical protein
MANKYMKKCPTSFTLKEMEIKTVQILSHPSLNSYHKNNNNNNHNGGEAVGDKRNVCTLLMVM